jgi:hypothetical protein
VEGYECAGNKRERILCTDLLAAQGNSQYRQHSLDSVGPNGPSYTFSLIDLQRYLTTYLSQNPSFWVQAHIYNLGSSTAKEKYERRILTRLELVAPPQTLHLCQFSGPPLRHLASFFHTPAKGLPQQQEYKEGPFRQKHNLRMILNKMCDRRTLKSVPVEM